MQLLESSFSGKVCALLRFIMISVFFPRRLKIKKISFIGRNLRLIIGRAGRIVVDGKIRIANNVELQSKGELTFGNGCGINSNSRIIAFEKINIGHNVSIAQYVSIFDHDHNMEVKDGTIDFRKFTTSPVSIGNNVWLGDKVTVTKGVTIGDNVVVGANSVVTRDISSNSLAAGVPARIIRSLEEENVG